MKENKNLSKRKYLSLTSNQSALCFWKNVFPTIIFGGLCLGLIFYALMFMGKDHKRCSKRDCIIFRECDNDIEYKLQIDLLCGDGWHKTIEINPNPHDTLYGKEHCEINNEASKNETIHNLYCRQSCQVCLFEDGSCYSCKNHLKITVVKNNQKITANENLFKKGWMREIGFMKTGFFGE